MKASAQLKEQIIQSYIMNVDFNGDFSMRKIRAELKELLQETPAVDVRYTKEKHITEDFIGNKIIVTDEKVNSVVIAFSDGVDINGMPIVHKFEYYIGNKL